VQAVPDPFDGVHGLDANITAQGAEKPEAHEAGESGMQGQDAAMILAQAVCKSQDNQNQAEQVQQANAHAQPNASPVGSDAPERPIPESLGEEQNG